MRRPRAEWCLLLAALVGVSAAAQSSNADSHPSLARADVRSVTVLPGEKGPVVEIVCTRPVTPQLQTLENPLRLVIDLPNSALTAPRRRIPFRNPQIKGIRISQYQDNPAVARVVVDLAAPVLYTWDAMGNRVHVRMHADESATAKPPSVPAFTKGVQPVAVPAAAADSGTLVETGSRVAAGSSITAGDETAVLRLTRGGEVRVCPGTTVSVSTSASGKDLLLGLSQGSMETHYLLQESVDSVLTPDFRVVLPGPGQFNLAIGADSRGNTCIASMPGSTASAIVAELLGSGTYEIKPEQQVLFREGRLDSVEAPAIFCGCPPPQEPVLRASMNAADVMPEPKADEKLRLARGDELPGSSSTSSLPPAQNNGVVNQAARPVQSAVQVETPLVFSGRERARTRSSAPPAPVAEVAALPPMAKQKRDPLPATVVIAPPAKPKAAGKGFWGSIGRFFGAIFR